MSEDAREMRELLLILTRELVNEPDAIAVEATEQGNRICLSLTCTPSDMGKIIGRGGKRAQAIRTVMKAKAVRLGRRVLVDFAG